VENVSLNIFDVSRFVIRLNLLQSSPSLFHFGLLLAFAVFSLDKLLLVDSLGFEGDFVHCKKNLKMLALSFRNRSQSFSIVAILVCFWIVTAFIALSYLGY